MTFRDNISIYWMGTLLFAGATFSSFLVLFLFILTDKPALVFIEITDTILSFCLLTFTLVFAIALAYTERKVRVNILAKEKEVAKA